MKKSILLIATVTIFANSLFAQNDVKRITLGIESGIGLLKPRVSQINGVGFVRKTQANLGHTGITIGMQISQKTELEFGRYVFSLYQNQAYFTGEGVGFPSLVPFIN